jgi:GNAT superfamily N-acetyltransferase
MHGTMCSIDGQAVAIRLAARMEDTLQAFAVRAACFMGEQDVPFSREFDAHDHTATHVIAYLGEEPIGTVRVRWFKSFAMPDRLAVVQRFRGREVGRLLLERVRALAESRGSRMLYTRVTPAQARYFEKQGWRRLDEQPGADRTVTLLQPIDAAGPGIDLEASDALALSTQYRGETGETTPATGLI